MDLDRPSSVIIRPSPIKVLGELSWVRLSELRPSSSSSRSSDLSPTRGCWRTRSRFSNAPLYFRLFQSPSQ